MENCDPLWTRHNTGFLPGSFFGGGGKIYCYVDFFCYADFPVVFGPHFREANCLRRRPPAPPPPRGRKPEYHSINLQNTHLGAEVSYQALVFPLVSNSRIAKDIVLKLCDFSQILISNISKSNFDDRPYLAAWKPFSQCGLSMKWHKLTGNVKFSFQNEVLVSF